MKKIIIVGLGGIGSWLVNKLDWLQTHNQLKEVEVWGYDNDNVENKNIEYQCFTADDLFENKAYALEIKCGGWFIGRNERINTPDVFAESDLVISAVDNLKFRKMLFENNAQNFHWIDLRSEGRTVMGLSKHPENTTNELMKLVEGDLEIEGSCQLQTDLNAGRIQLGNQIIATIGAQWVLNWLRKGITPAKFIHLF